jgi:diguanylate cyclase (GGDEF)-like protein
VTSSNRQLSIERLVRVLESLGDKALADDIQQLTELVAEHELQSAEIHTLQHYQDLAYRDPLTNLHNRRYFDERLAEEIRRGQRHEERSFSLLLVDIDNFKWINDHHGHVMGDATLSLVARHMEHNLRDHDVCCRTGGDEFTIILPETGSDNAERLRERLSEFIRPAGWDFPGNVSLSIGAATWPNDGLSAESLLAVADVRMYDNKRTRCQPEEKKRAQPRKRDVTLPWIGLNHSTPS